MQAEGICSFIHVCAGFILQENLLGFTGMAITFSFIFPCFSYICIQLYLYLLKGGHGVT